MRRTLVIFVIVAGLFAAATRPAAAEPRRAMKPADFAAFRRVGDPRISPNGEWIAYTVGTIDLADDTTAVNLWLANWDGSVNHPLTSGDRRLSHVRWRPDGRAIGFLAPPSSPANGVQIWLLPVSGGEPERVSDFQGSVEDFAWSPDSRRVVAVVRDPDPTNPGTPRTKTLPPIVIDRFQFKRDRIGYLTNRYSRLHLLTLATRSQTLLTSGDHDDLFPTWSPDGRELAFMSKRGADPDRSDEWSVLTIAAEPGAPEHVVTTTPENLFFRDSDQPLAWSPDGRELAFIHGGDPNLIEYATTRLAVASVETGKTRVLAPTLDRNVFRPLWRGDSVLSTVEDDAALRLVTVPPTGAPLRTVVGGRRCVTAFDTAPGGRTVVLSSTAEQPAEVFAVDGGELRPLSRQNEAFLSTLRIARVEETKFTSADGTEVHGFLVHPVDGPPAGRRSPALLRLHGGPQEQYDVAFDFEKQLFAANGYLVIIPNPRGSTGRGTDYAKAIFADWGHRDVEDDLAAVDDAVARGLADPERLGVGGWSYGGTATSYVTANTTRFKAATNGASASDILAEYGTNQYVTDYEHEFGPPWKNPAAWARVSFAFLHADQIKTPTLYLCSENDLNVPPFNTEHMYQALRSLGVPTQLVIYPGQGHVITKPSYVLDRYERYLQWYARWLDVKDRP